jgi:UDP-N-acetylglucosamine--N-acetylmuramyl-(pentapeptide) pyrophosphoryl-undecaprenol N-acetylglucosamine transferase
MKKPLILHEANALPGIANRIGNRFASAAGKAFQSTVLSHSKFVGMPIRQEILALASKKDPAKARKYFGLKPDSFTLLVTGGSLGARSINRTIEQSRSILAAAGVQVIQIVGPTSDLE